MLQNKILAGKGRKGVPGRGYQEGEEVLLPSFLSNKWPMACWVALLLFVDLVNADKLAGRIRKYKIILTPQKVSMDPRRGGL